ncbi:MAG: 50S ribosomal protein L4 [bacterium]|nr:50S ribosomal protein L4 [bacterium]
MKTDLYNQGGEVIGEVQLPEKVFGVAIDHDLLHQAAVAQLANRRQVLAHTKDRSEVSGGGKKPWRQKGTGRARHGSIRSPIWKGGGVAFGPSKDRNFSVKINKKVKRKAIFMALSGKVKDKQILVLDGVSINEAKTKTLVGLLKTISGKLAGYRSSKTKKDSVLMVSAKSDEKLNRAINNIGFAKTLDAKSLNVLDLLSYKYILLTQDAIPVIEETYKI